MRLCIALSCHVQPNRSTTSMSLEFSDMFVNWQRSQVPELAVLQSLKVIEVLASRFHTKSKDLRSMPSNGFLSLNPLRLCQTLWTRFRQMQIGGEAFYSGSSRPDSFGSRLGFVLKWLLKSSSQSFITDAYAPLTSTCMQAGEDVEFSQF